VQNAFSVLPLNLSLYDWQLEARVGMEIAAFDHCILMSKFLKSIDFTCFFNFGIILGLEFR